MMADIYVRDISPIKEACARSSSRASRAAKVELEIEGIQNLPNDETEPTNANEGESGSIDIEAPQIRKPE